MMGKKKISDDEIQKIFDLCGSVTDIWKKFPKIYGAAQRRGLKNFNIPVNRSHHSPYTDEEIWSVFNQCETLNQVRKNFPNFYKAAYRRDIEKFSSGLKRRQHKPYSDEEIQQIFDQCKTIKELKEKYPNIYLAATRRGIKKFNGSLSRAYHKPYSDEEIQQIFDQCNTLCEVRKKFHKIYDAATSRGIEKFDKNIKRIFDSSQEKELFNFIKESIPTAKKQKFTKLNIINRPYISAFELDIYIPELKKGIEFDGKYHHSFKGLKRGRKHWPDKDISHYHQIKDTYFLSQGIKILHIKEEDWLKDKEECMERCLSFLNS